MAPSTPRAALLVDYVLTAAVSVAAGTLALASAVPSLAGARVELARGFQSLGDRLVFSNGVLLLTGMAVVLLLAFDANVNSPIHLYVIGGAAVAALLNATLGNATELIIAVVAIARGGWD